MKTPGSVLISLRSSQKEAIHHLQLLQIFRNLYILKSMSSFSLLSYYIIKCLNKCVSTNQRPGRPSWFSDQPEKHKLGRGRGDLASCQVP